MLDLNVTQGCSVQVADLGRADLEAAPQLRDQGPDHGTLLLQRVHVAEEEVELERPGPHASDYGRSRTPRARL